MTSMRRIKVMFIDDKNDCIIMNRFPLTFCYENCEKNIENVTYKDGIYKINVNDRIDTRIEINCKTPKSNKNYKLRKNYSLKVTIQNEYIYRLKRKSKLRKFLGKHKILTGLGLITLSWGGFTFIDMKLIEINTSHNTKNITVNNQIDTSVDWKISVNDNVRANYFCDYCHIFYKPNINEAEKKERDFLNNNYQRTPSLIDSKGSFYTVDIPYNYQIELKNGAKLENIFIYDWGTGKKQSISLRRENKSEKSEIGTHDISCGDKSVLKVALSTKGDKKFKIDKPQDAYEKLLSNKSSIDDCEVNQSCYLGIYYAFKPMKSNKSLVYYEPKLSYGILEINALNEKRYFYIYIQLKSISAVEDEKNTGESRNQYLILTEEEFKNKTLFYEFIKDDSKLIKQMKAECEIMQEDSLAASTYNACKHLEGGQDELFSTISNHLKEVKQKK